MNYKEEFDKYNLLEKEVLIGMLIEKDKAKGFVYDNNECTVYQPGIDTSGKCMICNRLRHDHLYGRSYTYSF